MDVDPNEEQETTLYRRRGKQYQLMLGGMDFWEDILAAELLDKDEQTPLT